jgi:DNA-binding response OmpR family regulator
MNRQSPADCHSPDSRSLDPHHTRPRVLIVDDDVSLSRLLSMILRTANCDVLMASDGLGALEVARSKDIDLIVLDLRMPVLDGRGFFRELRKEGHQIPVLIASAYGARSAQVELGAEGAIEKPFDPDALIQAISNLLPPEKRAI